MTDVVCDNFDDGADFATTALIMASIMAEDGWDTESDMEMPGYVIGAGTEAFCPEHSHLVEDFSG